MRLGKMRAPYYRIVVADARTKRDGRSIETIGKYHPKHDPSVVEVNSERAQYWLGVGAQPTEAVAAISIGGGAGSPRNRCQSPVTRKMAATASVGWAPTPSQYCARSELTSTTEGSCLGWYLPIVSIERPSRLVRASATTIR